MKKNKLRMILLGVCFVFAFLGANRIIVKASAEEEEEETIQKIVEAMGSRDWDTYCEYLDEYGKEETEQYLSTLTEDTPGMNQIIGADLVSIARMQYEDFEDEVLPEEFPGLAGVDTADIHGYLVGLDLKVSWETHFYCNGVNYVLWIFVDDGTDIKLAQVVIPKSKMIEKYVVKNRSRSMFSVKELAGIDAIEAREWGMILNQYGEPILDYGHLTTVTYELKPWTSETTVPDSIYVKWNKSHGGDDQIHKVDFKTYCKQVLPNEWLENWPEYSLRAGADCVKTFGWYHCINPLNLNLGYNLTTTSQMWRPDRPMYDSTNAAFAAHFRSAMFNSDGKIFKARYGRGISGQAGKAGQGLVSQYGSKYLAEQGYSPSDILKYYYDYSDLSSGEIKFLMVDEK